MNAFWQIAAFRADEWTAALWRASWQGAIAIAIAWAIARWCTFLSPRVVCWLWRLACLKMLVALVWAQPLSLAVLPAAATEPAAANPVLSPATAPVVASESPLVEEPNLPLAPVVAEQGGVTFRGVFFVLWLTGASYVLGGIARQWISMRRLMSSASIASSDLLNAVCRQEAERLGVRRALRLCLSPYVDSPLLTGVWRPAIVLPAFAQEAFDAGEVRLMLAHELAHHRRRDLLWNWLPAIVRALFFFHPLVWFLARRWSEAQEAACDELLIQRRVARPAEYGRLLLKLAAREPVRSRSGLATAGVLGAYFDLERRIMAMARVRPFSYPRLALAAGVLTLIAAIGLIPWRLVPQTSMVAAPPDENPATTEQPKRRPGKIYVWADLELRTDSNENERYRGVIAIDPKTGSWRKVSRLGQPMRLSPDGSRMASSDFKSLGPPGSGGTSELFLTDLQNPQPVKLMDDDASRLAVLAWSPDGRRLLYHVNDGSEGWYGTSWSLELATKRKEKLPIPETDEVADWTSRGNWLVTISGRHTAEKNGYQLYVMHPDGTEQRRITQDRSTNLHACFSPDGEQIAYTRGTRTKHGTEHGMWVVNVDGSNARQILGKQELGANIVAGLCWSPDGRTLAMKVVENVNDSRNRKVRLEIVAAAGGAPRALQLHDAAIIHLETPEWR